MSTYISVELRRQVREQADYRCAYCRSAESLMGVTYEVDHIIPQSAGGITNLANLCLACPMCNRYKLDRVSALDALTDQTVRLFHPQQDDWQQHFRWTADGSILMGLTEIGRVTIDLLQINRLQIVNLRQYWVILSMHPPVV